MLEILRKKIDEVDYKIVRLLGCRFGITKKIGEYKKRKKINACDPKREFQMMEERMKWAKEINLNPKFISRLFKNIITEVKKEHRKIIKDN
ncbi:MAG: chorismate mutase [Patescibacteria group bacterium]